VRTQGRLVEAGGEVGAWGLGGGRWKSVEVGGGRGKSVARLVEAGGDWSKGRWKPVKAGGSRWKPEERSVETRWGSAKTPGAKPSVLYRRKRGEYSARTIA
jgi:hypothetical protein